MKNMRNVKPLTPYLVGMGLCLSIQPSFASDITPVLDGYAYHLNGDINIDLSNRLITFNTNMGECRQPNGDPPLDTEPYALATNGQFIGLQAFNYHFSHRNIYFSSETLNLVCPGGWYVDTLFGHGFDWVTELIYANGFD